MKSKLLLALLTISIIVLLIARYGLVDELVSSLILGKVPYTSIMLSWPLIAALSGFIIFMILPLASHAHKRHLEHSAPHLTKVVRSLNRPKNAASELPRRRYSYLKTSKISGWNNRLRPKAQLLHKKLLVFGRSLTNRLQRISIFRKTSA